MYKFIRFIAAILATVAMAAYAESEHKHTPAESSEVGAGIGGQASFDFLKSLEGQWVVVKNGDALPLEGEERNGEIIWDYTVTSAGHVVRETVMAGTSKEMFTVYHMNHGRVEGVHYCIFNNFPRFIETAPIEGYQVSMADDGKTLMNAHAYHEDHMQGNNFRLTEDGRLFIKAPGFFRAS